MKRKIRRLIKKFPNKNENQIKALINKACIDMHRNQPNIFNSFTHRTRQTEWNLGHHLAFELKKFLPQYDCDLDVIKTNEENKRPDIIFHTRGKVANDFLVIEVKWRGGENAMENDANKIREFWFDRNLNYKFGAVVYLHSDKTSDIRVFRNENRETNG